MRLFLWIAPCVLVASVAPAAEFPYEAVIDGNEVYVRSGPGKSYYPTSRLNSGDRVSVHRHDPGGWYMIAPPPGSFSWIRAEYVKRTGPDTGEVTANNVVVRVGSEFGDARDVEQRRMNIGDTVEIIGEETFPGDGGAIRMYKIKPPNGEWRWVPGQHVIPRDQRNRGERERNPFERPGNAPPPQNPPELARTTGAGSQSPPVEQGAGNSGGEAVVRTLPEPDRLKLDRDRLNAIDLAFREMVERPVAEWDLDPLEKEYRHLRETSAHPALKNQIDLRLEAVERYRARRKEYDDFIRLTRDTDRRDRELLAMRHARERVAEIDETPPPSTAAPDPGSNATPPPAVRHETRSQPRFDGAGIVQRITGAAPGRPSHVLLAPDGRLLAFLVAEPGVNLDLYLGREMGLNGDRGYRQELGADLIRVRSLTPVRLKR